MLEKIVALSGDVTRENFGLSPSDLNLIIENVSIVFNLAATVRFDEELKSALQMNVKGPMYLLEICRRMKNLDVSSFYRVVYIKLILRNNIVFALKGHCTDSQC
jgi:thioester reductase-like protein